MDQHTQRTALKRGVERNLIYPQDPAPGRCEARVSLANGLPPAPRRVQQVDVVTQQQVVHQPLGKAYSQVLVAMRVDVPLHIIGTNHVKDAIENIAEVIGVVETQLRLRGRGDEDRGCDVELKVELNCHNANGLHHQSPATRRLRGGWLGSLGEPLTSRWKRRTRRRPLRRSLRSPTPQGGQWPRRPWSCPMPSAMP